MKRSQKSLRLRNSPWNISDNELHTPDGSETEQNDQQIPFPLEVQLDEDFPSHDNNGDVQIMPISNFGSLIPEDIDSDEDGGIACELCGRRFPNITGLRTHKRSHKDYEANFGRAFYEPPPVLNEKQQIVQVPSDDEETGFPCSVCKRCFPNIQGLRTHERFFGHLPIETLSQTFKKATKSKQGSRIRSKNDTAGKARLRIKHTSNLQVDKRNASIGPHGEQARSGAGGGCLSAEVPPVNTANVSTKNGFKTTKGQVRTVRVPVTVTKLQTNHGSEPDCSFFSRQGMFYVCKLCGSRNLHINGFRSHWNRHIRDGEYCPSSADNVNT